MIAPKNINDIKRFNLNLIKENFNLNDIELKLLESSLKCDENICLKHNKEIFKNKKSLYYYLPLPIPNILNNVKVSHFFICKEPSTGFAKKSQNNAWAKVINKECTNFIGEQIKLSKLQILFIAFFQIFGHERFYITDLSKCAINPKDVKLKQAESLQRYDCCKALIEYEVRKFTNKDTIFYLVGDHSKETKSKLINIIGNRVPIELPHYAIQFSCPDHINKMLFSYVKELRENELKEEILKGYDQLVTNIKNNFILGRNLQTLAKENISPTYMLLFLIYKSSFERIKNGRNLHQL